MQPDWNKIDFPKNVEEIGKGLEAYLDSMRSQLQSESMKVQHLLDLVLIELQNQTNQNK